MHYYILDCFAEEKYRGNQLAVFIQDTKVEDREMQRIAQEIGFSESVFLLPNPNEDGSFNARIFTPDVELPFAGHPVIGTAFVIDSVLGERASTDIVLSLPIGLISVSKDNGIYTMKQRQPIFGEVLEKTDIMSVINLTENEIDENLPIQWVSTGLEAIIIPLKSRASLSRCKINYPLMDRFIEEKYKCSILAFTSQNGSISVRVFMDDEGYFEDAATGSANGDLAAYLMHHGCFRNDDARYVIEQGADMGRTSKLYVHTACKDGIYTIEVGGKVQLVAEGNWYE